MNNEPYDFDDDKEAVKFHRLYAEQGDAEAQFNLGQMYREGLEVAQDYKEAVKWYCLSAEQGDARAQCDLGMMYDKGQGVEQDYKEAEKLFRFAAEQGIAEAQGNLGVMSLSAYPLMVFLVSKVSKRDLEEEQRIRDEKRKGRKAKGGGPPIMNRDGF